MQRRDTPLTRAIQSCKPALAATFTLSVFINLTLFVSPIYSMQVYDRVLTSRNLGTLLMLTLIVALFIVLYGILEYARANVLVRAGVRFNEVIAKPLFELVMTAQRQGREAAAREALKDADILREGISGGTFSTVFDMPWAFIFVALCFLMHPVLGLVACTAAVAIFLCALVMELITRKGLAEVSRHSAEHSRFSLAALRNADLVRGLGMDGAVSTRWTTNQSATVSAQAYASERGSSMVALTKTVRMGVQTALLGTGAYLAIDGAISPGMMMAAMIVMGRALQPVEQAVANWKRLSAAHAAHGRLTLLFSAIPESSQLTALPAPKGDLAVDDITLVAAKGGPAIIRNATFSLEQGSILAVIGPSGSGKSSLARALAGVWQPAKGAVRLDGAALTQWDPDALGAFVGYLPQEIDFFPGTIAENIGRLAAADDKAVIAAAQVASVHQTILKMPKGYDTLIGEGGIVLSGGQRQRIGLARALYGRPRLVILDEPNSNLDSEGEAALDRALQLMKAAKCTVVLVTHKPQILRHADLVLALCDGTIKHFGSRDEVMTKIAGPKFSHLTPVAAFARSEPQRASGGMAAAAVAS